jgi:hypothetical protein
MSESEYLAHRAKLREQLVGRLNDLRERAIEGEMPGDQLRVEMEEILRTYVPEAADELIRGLDPMLASYGELTDAVERKNALERLLKSLGG